MIITITYICYWKGRITANKDNSGSDLSHNRRGESDTLSISNLTSIPLQYRYEVRHEGHQNEVKDFKDKTGRHNENTGINDNEHSLQENVTTYI